jgi:hypothetical protein
MTVYGSYSEESTLWYTIKREGTSLIFSIVTPQLGICGDPVFRSRPGGFAVY